MVPDLATRVYNHSFRIDPIIRTLLDTDFYKLLMLQMIWKHKPNVQVTFALINRTPSSNSPMSSMKRNCARSSITRAHCACRRTN